MKSYGKPADLVGYWLPVVWDWSMAQPTAAEDEQEYLNPTEEDEDYLRLPLHESTGLEEEYICLPSHGSKEQEEEKEMDEEQQVLCEGSLCVIV